MRDTVLYVALFLRIKGLAKQNFAIPIIFTFPLNPPLTKGDLLQVSHLLIYDSIITYIDKSDNFY